MWGISEAEEGGQARSKVRQKSECRLLECMSLSHRKCCACVLRDRDLWEGVDRMVTWSHGLAPILKGHNLAAGLKWMIGGGQKQAW